MSARGQGPQVLLLRGINVGGHHKVPMKELRALCESLGCEDVRSYIQSGNLVLRPGKLKAADLSERVAQAIEAQFGFAVPVVRRDAAAFERAATAHPLEDREIEPKLLFVGFLSAVPDPERVAAMEPSPSPPDELILDGQEVYMGFPGGSARSKLTPDWIDRRLGVVSTWRNWRTVQKLREMCANA